MERIVRDVWLTIPGECDIFNSKKCRQCMERIYSQWCLTNDTRCTGHFFVPLSL